MFNYSRYIKKKKKLEEENPCWDGYEMLGMKEKDGKQVPNCVKKKTSPENKK